MFLASVSLAEQNVFFSWLAGTLDCPCFYHYFRKKPKTHWMLVQGLGLALHPGRSCFLGDYLEVIHIWPHAGLPAV